MATGSDDGIDPDEEELNRGAPGEPGGSDREPTGETVAEDDVTSDERTWAILVHASAFAGLFVPFGNILAPLLVWLIKREESEFVDANGKQALNFQMTWTVIVVFALFSLVVGVGLVLVPLVALAWVILVVLATVRASENEVYDYPLTVDLVS